MHTSPSFYILPTYILPIYVRQTYVFPMHFLITSSKSPLLCSKMGPVGLEPTTTRL